MGIGDPGGMVEQYADASRRKTSEGMKREWGTGEARITGVEFLNAAGAVVDRFQWGGRLSVRIAYEATKKIENPVFGLSFATPQGVTAYGNNTQIEGVAIASIEGKGAVTAEIGRIDLAPGPYLLSCSIHSADHRINYHRLDHAHSIAVEGGKPVDGTCYMPCSWRVQAKV
jgi:hypothetical protein